MPSPFKLPKDKARDSRRATSRVDEAHDRASDKGRRLAGPARDADYKARREFLGRGEAYKPNSPLTAEGLAKAGVSGLRTGLEGIAGLGGDLSLIQQALMQRAGMPNLSLLQFMPTSEQVAAFTDRHLGRDPWTRHQATNPFEGAASFTGEMMTPDPTTVIPALKGLKLARRAF